MDWITTNWPWLLAVSVLLRFIVDLLSNVSQIKERFGSLRNWIFRRHEVRLATQDAARKHAEQMDELLSGIESIRGDIENLKGKAEKAKQVDKLILRDIIMRQCDTILRRGWEYSDEVDDLNEKIDQYKALGGNGAVDSKVSRVRALAIKYRAEPWELEK